MKESKYSKQIYAVMLNDIEEQSLKQNWALVLLMVILVIYTVCPEIIENCIFHNILIPALSANPFSIGIFSNECKK